MLGIRYTLFHNRSLQDYNTLVRLVNMILFIIQFLSTGNDFATRAQCCTLWIVNPEETQEVLMELDALLTGSKGSH